MVWDIQFKSSNNEKAKKGKSARINHKTFVKNISSKLVLFY